MGNRRNAAKLILDILSLAEHGASKNRIVYGANMNSRLARRYIEFLLARKLLVSNRTGNVTLYVLTDRGERLLSLLSEVDKEIRELPPTTPKASALSENLILLASLPFDIEQDYVRLRTQLPLGP